VVADIGHTHDLLVAVDNSWLSPYFQQPLKFGVDLVVESTTKYLNGHDDVMGGAVLTNDAALGDRRHSSICGRRGTQSSTAGCCCAVEDAGRPDDRHQAMRWPLRVFWRGIRASSGVYYPGLAEHPGHAVALRQMRGSGGMVSFEIAVIATQPAVSRRTRLFRLASGFGGV